MTSDGFFALPEKMKNEIMVLLAKCPFPVTSFHQNGMVMVASNTYDSYDPKVVISLGLIETFAVQIGVRQKGPLTVDMGMGQNP